MWEAPEKTTRLTRDNVIYSFSPGERPRARVQPGQEVIFETLDCFSQEITSSSDKFENVRWDKINPATGPVFVEGAEAGDVLCVTITGIKVNSPGVMVAVPNAGAVGKFIRESQTYIIPIVNGLAHLPTGHMLEIEPMVGVIGVAPSAGPVSCGTPGIHGGNLDTKVIKRGSTVYLPVQVPGALLALGDLHALMGDGEILICGIEVSGEVTTRINLLKNVSLPFPLIETENSFYAVWSDKTLDLTVENLLNRTVQYISEATGLSPVEVSLVLTTKGNLQISQVVDPFKTCRMQIPKFLLKGTPTYP